MARTKGAKNKLSRDEKEFIEQLLRDSQEQFRVEFLRLADSDKRYDKAQFMEIRNALQRLVVPRPSEIKIKHDDEEFSQMIDLFKSYDDKDDKEKGDD